MSTQKCEVCGRHGSWVAYDGVTKGDRCINHTGVAAVVRGVMTYRDKSLTVVNVVADKRLSDKGVRDGWYADDPTVPGSRMFYPADMFTFDAVQTPQDSAKPEHRCLDPRAGTLRLEGGRCFWCGEQVDPPAQGSETGENRG